LHTYTYVHTLSLTHIHIQIYIHIHSTYVHTHTQAASLWDEAKDGRPFTDVAFTFQNGVPSHRAHKSILSARSEIFRGKLLDQSSEEFAIHNVRRETFAAFLEFLYTGKSDGEGTDGGELYDLASEYGIVRLVELLREGVDESNVAAAANYAVLV
jgi:hypothetical protein